MHIKKFKDTVLKTVGLHNIGDLLINLKNSMSFTRPKNFKK